MSEVSFMAKEWNYKHGWNTYFILYLPNGKTWQTGISTKTKKEAQETIKKLYEPEYRAKSKILGYKKF